MTLLEAARQALPGIVWEEQKVHNGATWVLGDFGEGRYSVFGVGDIANAVANIVSIRDRFDSLLGETPRAVLTDDLTALRERMRWRDVVDDCPDPFEDVILWNGYAFQGWLSDNDGRFYDPNGEQIYNVSHWRTLDRPQPLPAAPEVEP